MKVLSCLWRMTALSRECAGLGKGAGWPGEWPHSARAGALREPGALWGELIIEPSLREPTLIFINLQDKASRAVLLRRL